MDNARLDFLFKRYVNGSCSPQEELELMQFITENDSQQIKALLDELWNITPEKLPAEKAEKILHSILTFKEAVPIDRNKTNLSWLKAAAAISLLVISGAVAYQFVDSEDARLPVHRTAEVSQQHQFIKLPDGSTLILNTGSQISYPESFEDKKVREVFLVGEGFFDIKHDASKAFIVHTGKLSTTVLGTAFNIKAYPEQNDITVTVARGKVKVSNDLKVLGIISPDQQITFSKRNSKARQQEIKSKEVIAWTERDIFFDDISMEDAAQQLEDRFKIKIDFANEKIKNCRFTATFTMGEDINQILDVVCAFNKATYIIKTTGDIEISGNGCSLNDTDIN